jgi:hypothetical protein
MMAELPMLSNKLRVMNGHEGAIGLISYNWEKGAEIVNNTP